MIRIKLHLGIITSFSSGQIKYQGNLQVLFGSYNVNNITKFPTFRPQIDAQVAAIRLNNKRIQPPTAWFVSLSTNLFGRMPKKCTFYDLEIYRFAIGCLL